MSEANGEQSGGLKAKYCGHRIVRMERWASQKSVKVKSHLKTHTYIERPDLERKQKNRLCRKFGGVAWGEGGGGGFIECPFIFPKSWLSGVGGGKWRDADARLRRCMARLYRKVRRGFGDRSSSFGKGV